MYYVRKNLLQHLNKHDTSSVAIPHALLGNFTQSNSLAASGSDPVLNSVRSDADLPSAYLASLVLC